MSVKYLSLRLATTQIDSSSPYKECVSFARSWTISFFCFHLSTFPLQEKLELHNWNAIYKAKNFLIITKVVA